MAAAAIVLRIPPGEDALEHFFKAGLTDGLPVVPPTRRRVAMMLRGTALGASDIVGKCPPSYAEVTVEKLAIAAVMAGCTPEMFRIVVAATKAVLEPEFGLHGVHATTMGATPVVVVNGPCRHQAGVNFQHGACGSGTRSHCIGRAIKLLLQNVGRARLAGTESTTIGTPMKFGLCLGEWEERATFWEPLSVEKGKLRRDEDAVTVLACAGGPTQLVDVDSSPQELVQRLSKIMAAAYAPQMPFVNQALLIISPEHYDKLSKGGIDSKRKLSEALFRETSWHMFPYIPWVVAQALKMKRPGLPSFVGSGLGLLVRLLARVLRIFARPFLAISKFSSPGSFNIVVAGAPAGKFSVFMPGFGVGKPGMPMANMSVPVTMAVEPRPASLDLPQPQDSKDAQDILDPSSELASTFLTLAKRTGSFSGPVGMLDISKARGRELLDALEKKLRSQGVETNRYTKPTFSRPCPDGLRKTIVAECKSVILGLAD